MIGPYELKLRHLKRCAKRIKNGCVDRDEATYDLFLRHSNRLLSIDNVLHCDCLEMVSAYYGYASWHALLKSDLEGIDTTLLFEELGLTHGN